MRNFLHPGTAAALPQGERRFLLRLTPVVNYDFPRRWLETSEQATLMD
jgi:hypothetical protein